MDLPSLRAGVAVPPDVDTAIDLLLTRKAAAMEADVILRQPVLERCLANALAQPAARPAAEDQEPVRLAADALFELLVRNETAGSGRGTPPRP